MKRKLTKRNKAFMSGKLKGCCIGCSNGKFVFVVLKFGVVRRNKPQKPLQLSKTCWFFEMDLEGL